MIYQWMESGYTMVYLIFIVLQSVWPCLTTWDLSFNCLAGLFYPRKRGAAASTLVQFGSARFQTVRCHPGGILQKSRKCTPASYCRINALLLWAFVFHGWDDRPCLLQLNSIENQTHWYPQLNSSKTSHGFPMSVNFSNSLRHVIFPHQERTWDLCLFKFSTIDLHMESAKRCSWWLLLPKATAKEKHTRSEIDAFMGSAVVGFSWSRKQNPMVYHQFEMAVCWA